MTKERENEIRQMSRDEQQAYSLNSDRSIVSDLFYLVNLRRCTMPKTSLQPMKNYSMTKTSSDGWCRMKSAIERARALYNSTRNVRCSSIPLLI